MIPTYSIPITKVPIGSTDVVNKLNTGFLWNAGADLRVLKGLDSRTNELIFGGAIQFKRLILYEISKKISIILEGAIP